MILRIYNNRIISYRINTNCIKAINTVGFGVAGISLVYYLSRRCQLSVLLKNRFLVPFLFFVVFEFG